MTLNEHDWHGHHTAHAHHHHHHHLVNHSPHHNAQHPPSSTSPPMTMESFDSCSSPGQISLTSSNSSTFAMEPTNATGTTNHHHHHRHTPSNATTASTSSSSSRQINGRTSECSSLEMEHPKRSNSACALSLSDSNCSNEFMMCFLERKPYRPFRSNEEYLIAMKEDLAEWLNTLYGLDLTCDNFLQRLETGVILCQHANSVLRKVREWRMLNVTGASSIASGITSGPAAYSNQAQSQQPSSLLSTNNGNVCSPSSLSSCSFSSSGTNEREMLSFSSSPSSLMDRRELVPIKMNAMPGTFQARDNVANFIEWCRRIQIHECLLFETEDLVGRKNEKSFVLCLLEVARYGAKFGVLAPTLVQFEQEIDQEIENDNQIQQQQNQQQTHRSTPVSHYSKMNNYGHPLPYDNSDDILIGPQPQITNNDLESLHEKVVNLLSRCTCPVQFYLEHLSEGKYRIGDTRTLIFVRILRNHVMVRVGGGWDTLEHYLEKHDPCRCRFGHRYNNGARVLLSHSQFKSQQNHQQPMTMQVTVDRPDQQSVVGSTKLHQVNLSPIATRRMGQVSPSPRHAANNGTAASGSASDLMLNGGRRASTSSNDSQQTTTSSCSVPESIVSSSSSTSLLASSTTPNELEQQALEHHSSCHSMTNAFSVLPDRNNNIKGLANGNNNAGNSQNPSVKQSSSMSNNKPQFTPTNHLYKKRTSMDGASSAGCSSRIPKSKVPLSTMTPTRATSSMMKSSSLSQAHKLKSTSICSLTAANSNSRIPTSSMAIDHRKLLTNYGYSSHNIYMDCAQTNHGRPGGSVERSVHQRQQQSPSKQQNQYRNRYDKQKLNKSTMDLMSNEHGSFYNHHQVPKSTMNMANGKQSNPYQQHRRNNSTTSCSSNGSLPRTKSTTTLPTPSPTHFNKKNQIKSTPANQNPKSIIHQTTTTTTKIGNLTRNLQGSATSLNSAGSTEGGTTTGSSTGSLNEQTTTRRLSSPLPSQLIMGKTNTAGQQQTININDNNQKKTPSGNGFIVGENHKPNTGALVEVCSWLERNRI